MTPDHSRGWRRTRTRVPGKVPTTALFFTLFGLLIAVAGCATDDPPPASAIASDATSPTPTTVPAAPVITTRPTPLGTVLTDVQGHTLYYLTTEAGGQDRCTLQPGCSLMWPELIPAGSNDPTAASGIPGVVGVITAADGTLEVTYDGWPLHRFGNEGPGSVAGEDQQSFGGSWYVATPDLAPAPSGATPSPLSPPGLPTPFGPTPTNPFAPTTPMGFPTQPALPTISPDAPPNDN